MASRNNTKRDLSVVKLANSLAGSGAQLVRETTPTVRPIRKSCLGKITVQVIAELGREAAVR